MNKILAFFIIILSTFFFGQDNTFYRKYNLGGMQGALQLATTIDGGFVATGQHEGNGSHGDCDIYVYKLDVCGNIEWFNIYGTSAQEGGRSIQQTADTGYIVSGLYAQGSSRAFNMKLDAQGNTEWIKVYPFEWMMYAIETVNGDFISTGTSAGQLFVIRTDNLGNIIWSKRIDGLGSTSLYLYELNNGDIIVSVIGVNSGRDIALCRLDSSGNLIWGKAYGGSGWSDQDHTAWSCKGAVNQNDNSIVITSPTYQGGMGGENILVAKVDINNGSLLWARSVGGNDRDQSRDIAIYPGGYVVLGNTSSFPTPVDPNNGITEALGEKDVLLFAFDSLGNSKWARTYGGSDRDKGIGVRYNFDNGFTISAYTTSSFFGNNDASMDPLFIKTDSLGIVACQMSTPPLQFNPININAFDAGAVVNMNFSHIIPAISMTSISPNDGYLCQQCVSIPIFTPEDTMICVNDTARFFNTTTFGLKCFQEWSVEGQTFNGGNDLEWTFSTPGDYEVVLYSTCGNSQDTMKTTIHVYDPQISTSDPVCEDGALVQFTSNIPNGNWSGNGMTTNNLGTFNPANAGLGYVQIFYDLPELCQITDSIKVNPKPIADAGLDYQNCHILDTTIGVVPMTGQSYLWSPSLHLSSSSQSNPQFYYENLTNIDYTLNYTLTVTIDSSGCFDSDVALITVGPRPVVDAGANRQYCENEMITLSGLGAQTYVWDNNVLNNVPFIQNTGTQIYQVIGTDAFGCFNSDSVEIVVHPLPTITGYYDTMVCEYELITLFGGGGVSYVWNNGVQNNTPFVESPGSYVYTVSGTDINNCVSTDVVNVTVFPQPYAAFKVNQDELIFAFVNQSTGAVNYYWDFGDNSGIENETNVYHYYADLNGSTYTVSLIAVSEFGCLDTTSLQVTSPLPILFYVPNTFTPDNDEHNNIFYPFISGNVDLFSYEMNIIDRWGEIIFTTKDIDYGWDGYYLNNNTKVQVGIYTWQIKFKKKTNDEFLIYHGYVSLIR